MISSSRIPPGGEAQCTIPLLRHRQVRVPPWLSLCTHSNVENAWIELAYAMRHKTTQPRALIPAVADEPSASISCYRALGRQSKR
jgi:hypothetical protein